MNEHYEKRLFKILDIINNLDEDLFGKYVSALGVLKITIYNINILELSIDDIISTADVFNEISLSKLKYYNSILGDEKNLCKILNKGKTYSEKYKILNSIQGELDIDYGEEISQNKNMIS